MSVTISKDLPKIIEVFDSPKIREEIQKLSLNLLLKIQVEGNFDQLNSNELKILSEKCKENSIVILVSSKNEEKFLLYWKAAEAENFLKFVPYNYANIENVKIFYEFLAEFIVKSLKNDHFGEKLVYFLQLIKPSC